jgi:hypothetical protein
MSVLSESEPVRTTFSRWLSGSLPVDPGETSFFQKEAAQSTKIVENPATRGHMPPQLIHIEKNELKSLFTAIRTVDAGERNVSFDFGKSDLYCFGKQVDVFVGTFDVVERSLGAMAHRRISLCARDACRSHRLSYFRVCKPDVAQRWRSRGFDHHVLAHTQATCYI